MAPERWDASGVGFPASLKQTVQRFEDAGQGKKSGRDLKKSSGNEGADYETIRRHQHPVPQIVSLKPQLRLFLSMVSVLMHESQNMSMLMKSESRIRSRNL